MCGELGSYNLCAGGDAERGESGHDAFEHEFEERHPGFCARGGGPLGGGGGFIICSHRINDFRVGRLSAVGHVCAADLVDDDDHSGSSSVLSRSDVRPQAVDACGQVQGVDV